MEKTAVSIIIPARHEEELIAQTIRAVDRLVKMPHEIIVVHDVVDREDTTGAIVHRLVKKISSLRLVTYRHRKGKSGFSGAIRRGIAAAKGKAVVIIMADMCDDPKIIDRMFRDIEHGWDVVCGSRYMQGGNKIGGPRIQGIGSAILNKYIHAVLHIPTTDATNAFKMYRRDVCNVFPREDNWGVEYSLAMLLAANNRGKRIIDIPTVWRGRTKGISKFSFLQQGLQFAKIITHEWRSR